MNPILRKAGLFVWRHWPASILIGFLLFLIMTPHKLERFLVYHPTKVIGGNPSDLGLAYEDIHPVTEDQVRLHGWYVPSRGARITLLIFHGNAGNIGDRLPWLELLRNLQAHVLIIDYRGFGNSEGQPFEEGLYKDARAAYSWWSERHDAKKEWLILIGESLGGAVAIDLATRVPVSGLILQSTFTSARDMAKTIPPLGMLQPLTGIHFDSVSKITAIQCPKLFIHGDRDDIVPLRLGRKLYETAPPPKQFYEVPGASHNDLLWIAGQDLTRAITAFLSQFR